MMRLSKFIADSGVASRRKAESLITGGRVKVNNIAVTEQGTNVDPVRDRVTVDDCLLTTASPLYVLINKPKGYISSAFDPQGRPTVLELVRGIKQRLYPVGRLDCDTEGLLMLTNDGEFCNLMTHPSHNIWKRYEVLVKGEVKETGLSAIREGMLLSDGFKTAPARIKEISKMNNNTILEIEIHEGKKRQIKKMCAEIGHPVISLKRTAFAFLDLKGVPVGKFRYLSEEETEKLKNMARSSKTRTNFDLEIF